MKNTMLVRLNKELVKCMNDDKAVKFHVIYDGQTIRYAMVPQEVEMDDDGISISYENFQVDIIKENIEDIQYDEFENSYCVQTCSSETYFDF